MSTYGGVEYKGKNLKLWKSFSVGNSRDGEREIEFVHKNEEKAQEPINKLGKEWDAKMTVLRSNKTTYPWIKELFLDYTQNIPITGEILDINLDAIFSAFGGFSNNEQTRPSGATFIIKKDPWLPIQDLISSLLLHWAWELDANTRLHRKDIGKFYAQKFFNARESDNIDTNILECAEYTSDIIAKLKSITLQKDSNKKIIALQVLGRGGWVNTPAFFAPFLKDPDASVKKEAMLALFLFPNRQGLGEIKKNIDSLVSLFQPRKIKSFKSYILKYSK